MLNRIKKWENFVSTRKDILGDAEHYANIHKHKFIHLWRNGMDEWEIVEILKNYFIEFPEEMRQDIDIEKIKIAGNVNHNPLLNYIPRVNNIGGIARY
jgi:hypothetical protein